MPKNLDSSLEIVVKKTLFITLLIHLIFAI